MLRILLAYWNTSLGRLLLNPAEKRLEIGSVERSFSGYESWICFIGLVKSIGDWQLGIATGKDSGHAELDGAENLFGKGNKPCGGWNMDTEIIIIKYV